MYMEISLELMRETITGKTTWRKCPACDKNGTEYWDAEGMSVLPYPHPDWGDDYDSGPCEDCGGLGYVQNADAGD